MPDLNEDAESKKKPKEPALYQKQTLRISIGKNLFLSYTNKNKLLGLDLCLLNDCMAHLSAYYDAQNREKIFIN